MWKFFKKKENQYLADDLPTLTDKKVESEEDLIEMFMKKLSDVNITTIKDKHSELYNYLTKTTKTEGYYTIDVLSTNKNSSRKRNLAESGYSNVSLNLVSLIIMADDKSSSGFYSVGDEVNTAITIKKLSADFVNFTFKTFWGPIKNLMEDYSKDGDNSIEKLRTESAVREILVLAFDEFFVFYLAKEQGIVEDSFLSPSELIVKDAIEKYKESEIGINIVRVKEELGGHQK